MKHLLLIVCSIVWINFSKAQNPTLRIYANGFIYDSLTMLQLGNMVKNQGINEKTCYSKTVFYAPLQAKGYYIKCKKNAKQALEDINNNISLADFLKKHRDLDVSTGAIAVQEDGKYDIVTMLARQYFYALNHTIDFNREVYPDDSLRLDSCKNQWFFNTYPSEKEPKEIEAFYYLENFESKPLSKKYNEIVQRNICLIDTTTLTYPREEFYCCGAEGLDSGAVFKFMQHYNHFIQESYRFPTTDEWNNMDSIEKQDAVYFNLKQSDNNEQHAIRNLANKKEVLALLDEAVNEVAEYGGSTTVLEKYASKWLTKDKYLTILRSHANVDFSDYIDLKRHYQISKTAIELNNWVVFIRSYMDFMDIYNHNEEDNGRNDLYKVPIKELESVGINTFNLYISTCIAIENRHKFYRENPPYSIGKAFAHSDRNNMLEQFLSNMLVTSEKSLSIKSKIVNRVLNIFFSQSMIVNKLLDLLKVD